jgi:hypothetical protein
MIILVSREPTTEGKMFSKSKSAVVCGTLWYVTVFDGSYSNRVESFDIEGPLSANYADALKWAQEYAVANVGDQALVSVEPV